MRAHRASHRSLQRECQDRQRSAAGLTRSTRKISRDESRRKKPYQELQLIEAFAYCTQAFISLDNTAMQTEASESHLSPPPSEAQHHSPALGNSMPLVLALFFYTTTTHPEPHAMLKPFPNGSSLQQCTKIIVATTSAWEGPQHDPAATGIAVQRGRSWSSLTAFRLRMQSSRQRFPSTTGRFMKISGLSLRK